jgi:enamine deaminase RidA (YjgF/YER057c/UK114 family)
MHDTGLPRTAGRAATSELPTAPGPRGNYVPAVVHDGIGYSAGMTPRVDGVLAVQGVVGADISIEQARMAAGIAADNALSALAAAAGGLDRVERCLRMTVYVAAAPGFRDHSAVADGASEALQVRLGGRAELARSAIGVASLPGAAPVEVELTVTLTGGTR